MAITGKISVVNNEKGEQIQLTIQEDQREELRDYQNFSKKNKTIEGEFRAHFYYGDFKDITFKKQDQDNELVINSVNRKGEGMLDELGLNEETKDFEVELFAKHHDLVQHLVQSKEQAEQKQQELQNELDAANTEKTDLETQISTSNADVNKLKAELEAKDEEIAQLKQQQPDAAQLQAKDEKIKDLEEQLSKRPDAAQLQAKDEEINTLRGEVTELKAAQQNDGAQLQSEINKQLAESKELVDKLQKENKELEAKNTEAAKLQTDLKAKEEEIAQLKQQQPDAAQLQAKDKKIKDLEEQLSNQPNAAQLQAKDKEINTLRGKVTELEAAQQNDGAQLQSEINKQLAESKGLVDKLQKENKELEAKNKTTEQPKQGSGARYTATVGMGLAAGLIAFTALERTVRLEMLVMIGIAVASAIVAGGITYAVLPSTQVDGAKPQEVNGNKKSK